VGYFDESLRRGEDWELNLRIRTAGHIVWFDPALEVTYWPRESWRKLVKQFTATGIWRGELVRRFGGQNPWRFFVPPILVLSIVASAVVLVLQLTGVLTETASLIASISYLGPGAYVAMVLLLALVIDRGATWRDRWFFVVVLPTMHLSWGCGFIVGLMRGARDTLDTSRTEVL
jgi:hypothetical protein